MSKAEAEEMVIYADIGECDTSPGTDTGSDFTYRK